MKKVIGELLFIYYHIGLLVFFGVAGNIFNQLKKLLMKN